MRYPVPFWSRVIESSTGCWLWTGPVTVASDGGKPYGVYFINKLRVRAHRYSYEEMIGPIPEGLEIDHLCETTLCVRPDHLEPVPHSVNTRRAVANDASCHRGHPRNSANTFITKQGKRRCRPCNSERQRRYNNERKIAS